MTVAAFTETAHSAGGANPSVKSSKTENIKCELLPYAGAGDKDQGGPD